MLKITTEAVKEAAEVRPPSNSKAARRDSTHWAKYNFIFRQNERPSIILFWFEIFLTNEVEGA